MEEADLEYLRDKLEYLHLKSDFFNSQSEIWSKLIFKVELKQKESLKEEQELIDKFNEREIEKEKLISHLKSLKKQVKVSSNWSLNNGKEVKNNETGFTRINGFFNCTECEYKAKRKCYVIQHINAVHRKLKPYKCSDCDKGMSELFNVILIKYLIYFLIYFSVFTKRTFNNSSKAHSCHAERLGL